MSEPDENPLFVGGPAHGQRREVSRKCNRSMVEGQIYAERWLVVEVDGVRVKARIFALASKPGATIAIMVMEELLKQPERARLESSLAECRLNLARCMESKLPG